MKYMSLFIILSLSFCSQVKENIPRVSTEEVVAALETKSATLVDCNNQETFEKNHIPSAVFFDRQKEIGDLLPQDRNSKMIFYCKNEKCGASHKAAELASDEGYKNIFVYPNGIDGWIEAGKPIEALTINEKL